MNERVLRDGHYLIVVSAGFGTTATVPCPDCGLRYSGEDDVRPAAFTAEKVGPRAPRLADDLRAAAVALRALARFGDRTCEGVRRQLLAELIMLT